MKRFDNAKDLFVNKAGILHFKLKKEYEKRGPIEGAFRILAKKDIIVNYVTVSIRQSTQALSANKTIAQKDIEKHTVEIGKRKVEGPWDIESLKDIENDFSVPLKFNKAKKEERKVYKGDMALMNKAHDESRRRIHSYIIVADVKIKGQRKLEQFTHSINIE